MQAQNSNESFELLIHDLAQKSRQAFHVLAHIDNKMRNSALALIASGIRQSTSQIMQVNQKDIEQAHKNHLSDAMVDRLRLDAQRIEEMAAGVENIALRNDPLHVVLDSWVSPVGLNISRVSVPLGVLGVIYESRPNVTIDAAALAIKSGNCVILRGGSDAFHTNSLLAEIIQQGLKNSRLPKDAVLMAPDSSRGLVSAMLKASGLIDVIIPRGGKSLVAHVQKEARVPVLAHLDGICHMYVDRSANEDMAIKVSANAKLRRPGICGALETLLIDHSWDARSTYRLLDHLMVQGCTVLGCPMAQSLHPEVKEARSEDYGKEFLAPILAVKIVKGVDEAINHIRQFGSGHTESIIGEDLKVVSHFLSQVDSAIVMHNTSTQFADGGQFGMGAEIGIATGRLHARGPVGVEQLTSFKYIVKSDGMVRPV